MINRTYLLGATCGALLLALAATFLLWREPQVVVISSGPDTQQTMLESLLAANGFQYRKNEEGQITVAESDLMPVRQLAAERGVISAPRDGLETFQDDNYGATEFVQRVNYQRALQAEVERTILKLDGVIDARVHMRQPQRTTFFRREQQTRASILVKLEDWVELSVLAPSIAQIAAGAVDGLEVKDVNIVADNGDVTAGDGTAASMLAGGRQKGSLERYYREAIRAVLNPLYSSDRVGITVTVEIDRRKRTYRRDNVPIVNSRVVTRSEVGDASESVKTPGKVNEYSYGTESESIETPAGSIARIGVGVIVADYLSPTEIQNIEQLIASATGLSLERGDTIKVMSYTSSDSSAMSDEPVMSPTLAVIEEGIDAPVEPEPLVIRREALVAQLSAIYDSEMLPFGVLLLSGMLLLPLWFERRRHNARRRLVRDVVQWIEEGNR